MFANEAWKKFTPTLQGLKFIQPPPSPSFIGGLHPALIQDLPYLNTGFTLS